MTEPNEAVVDDQDPEADTPEDTDEPDPKDTPEPEQPTDWEARYRELEKAHGRQTAEIGIWRRGERPAQRGRQAAQPPEQDEDEQPSGGPEVDDHYVAQLEDQSWALAEARYGADAVEAYSAAYEILDRADTPADYIAAFEAYHEIRSQGGTQAEAAAAASGSGRKTRAQAVQPRVDPNSSDAGPDLTDKDVEEARKSGKLEDFVHAATRRMGL